MLRHRPTAFIVTLDVIPEAGGGYDVRKYILVLFGTAVAASENEGEREVA